MKTRLSKLTSMLCVFAMLLSMLPLSAGAAGGLTAGGWFETIYAELSGVDESAVTAVSWSGTMNGSLDAAGLKHLVRSNGSGGTRIDIPGLKAGTYDLTVTAGTTYTASGIEVLAYDRSGYAHYKYNEGVGAYKDDGTLKDNAIVIYVTEETKNTVELSYGGTTVKGIGNILNSVGQNVHDPDHEGMCKRVSGTKTNWGWANTNEGILLKLAQANIPLVVRIVGNVSCVKTGSVSQTSNGFTLEGLTSYDVWDYGGSVGDNGAMARMKSAKNVTIEGIGTDAVINGWGIHFMCEEAHTDLGKSFEVRNLKFENVPEDCLGMEGQQEGGAITASVERVWVHNCSFIGPHISNPAEGDKSEGDGACDFKRGQYMTMSYCEFYDYHKTNLIGSSDSSLQYHITWHHNYWQNCQARGPLVRNSNIHIYNNYYNGTTDYAENPRANAFIFSEYNLFDKVKNPGKLASGGVIKSYHDTFTACSGEQGATIVSDKSDTVSSACKYANFDTNAAISYIPSGDYALDTSLADMKAKVAAWGGPMDVTVKQPDDVDPSVVQDNSRKPAGDLALPYSKTTFTAADIAANNTDNLLVNDAKINSGGIKISGTVIGQNILFKVDRPVTVEYAGSGVELVNEMGETIPTTDGKTDQLPAGIYFIQPSTYDVGNSKFKEGTLTKLVVTQAAPPCDHTYAAEVTKPATCMAEGQQTKTCSKCGDKVLEKIPRDPNAHDYNVPLTSAGAEGHSHLCANGCGTRDTAVAHSMKDSTNTPGTCTTPSTTGGQKCENCEYITGATDGSLDPTNHAGRLTHVSALAATCVTDGVKEHYHCSGCGKDYSDENGAQPMADTVIPAAGHDFAGGVWVDNKDGTHSKECSKGCHTKNEAVPHTYADGACSACGAKEPVLQPADYVHNFDDGMKPHGIFKTLVGSSNTKHGPVTPPNVATPITTALKMNSDGEVSILPLAAGTATFYFGGSDGNALNVEADGSAITGSPLPVTGGKISFKTEANKTYTVTKGKGESYLFYVEWVPDDSPSGGDTVNKEPLNNAITAANAKLNGVVASKDGADVSTTDKWATAEAIAALKAAIEKAEGVYNNADANQTQVSDATTELNTAIGDFSTQFGTMTGGQAADKVDSVTLDRTAATLKEGEKVTLTATISPSTAVDQNVTWNSSNTAVATVANGEVTAVKAGTANITATAGGKSATCVVTVKATTEPDQTIPHSWKAADTTPVSDNDAVAVGTKWVDDYFSLGGTKNAVWRTSGKASNTSAMCLQLSTREADKDELNYMEFTVADNAQSADVEIEFSSTSSKNTSAIALKAANGELVESTGRKTKTTYKGQSKTSKVTFTGVEPGTYRIIVPVVEPADVGLTEFTFTPDSNDTSKDVNVDNPNLRGTQIYAITVTETIPGGEIVDDSKPVQSVTVTPATVTLNVGETKTLAADVQPTDADDKTVTWSSSNAAVASVNAATGEVTANAAGEVIITANAGGVNGQCTVTVTASGEPGPGPDEPEPVAVTGVKLNITETTLFVGDTAELKATVEPADAADKTVSWSSSDSTKVSVDANGKITAVAAGSATITVTTTDGGKTATCAVTVEAAGGGEVTTTKHELNASTDLTAFAQGAKTDGATELVKNYFTVIYSAKARVDAHEKSGFKDDTSGFTSTQRLSFGGKSVVDASKTIKNAIRFTTSGKADVEIWWVQGGGVDTGAETPTRVDIRNVYLVNAATGATVTKTDESGTDAASDTSVKNQAIYDKLTLQDAGTYYVANLDDNNNIYKVVVTENTTSGPVAVTGVTLDKTTLSLNTTDNKTAQLTATVQPTNATNKNVKWTSGNESVATVSATGVVTAVAEGSADITVTTVQGAKTAHCAVTVTAATTPAPGPGPAPTPSFGGSGGGSVSSGKTQTVKNDDGTVSTVYTATSDVDGTDVTAKLNTSQANSLVNSAIANKSDSVVIAPAADAKTENVTVSLPASALDKLADKTDADLTVQTPVGDVTLPTQSVADLANAGGKTVAVNVEKAGDGVKVTVQSGDKTMDTLSGGLTAAVPVTAPSPDAVAVLVAADGTEKLIKTSYVEGGKLHAHINGSGTVRVIENKKDFIDVDGSWAKDAIHFATSRELFNGVNQSQFAPDQTMTRSMLVTVLYRLEDAKEEVKSAFADVPTDTWYSEAVAWANDTGVVTGKPGNLFAPDEEITREQLATILYRYATKLCGQPTVAPDSKALDGYPDKAAVSSFAAEAMTWAVEQGIITGRGDKTLAPGGFASRAEVSTMLMRFIKAVN